MSIVLGLFDRKDSLRNGVVKINMGEVKKYQIINRSYFYIIYFSGCDVPSPVDNIRDAGKFLYMKKRKMEMNKKTSNKTIFMQYW